MQKVYLLLRDNQRTGPHSLEELLELQLQPFDLVWVDNRSTGWRYPSEIDSLKSYVGVDSTSITQSESIPQPTVEQKSVRSSEPIHSSGTAVKKIYVSMPVKTGNANSYKQEEDLANPGVPETFNPIPKYAPGYQEPVSTIRERSSEDNLFKTATQKEEYSPLFIPKKKKRSFFTLRSFAAFIGIMMLGAAGYYFLTVKKSKTTSPDLVSQSVQQPVVNEPETTSDDTETAFETNQQENKAIKSSSKKSINKETLTNLPVDTRNKKTNKQGSIADPEIDPVINKEAEIPETVVVNDEKTQENIPGSSKEPVTKEKKKKLGEVIKDIFKPKEKARQEEKKETAMEDPKPATNRQSTKREDGNNEMNSKPEPIVDIASFVDISSNAPDNWMMGVKGLKLTLRNRSNVAIQTASVEIVYYNDNKEVLDKKLIYFSNVAAKGKSIMAAPDHKYADHVTFKLATVVAKEDRFARN